MLLTVLSNLIVDFAPNHFLIAAFFAHLSRGHGTLPYNDMAWPVRRVAWSADFSVNRVLVHPERVIGDHISTEAKENRHSGRSTLDFSSAPLTVSPSILHITLDFHLQSTSYGNFSLNPNDSLCPVICHPFVTNPFP